jgi:hypothetical protein
MHVSKIRCDGESEKFCKIFWELNSLLVMDWKCHFNAPGFFCLTVAQRFLLSEMNRPNSMILSGSLVKLSPYRSFRPERNNSGIFFSPVQSEGPTDNLCCKNEKGRRKMH